MQRFHFTSLDQNTINQLFLADSRNNTLQHLSTRNKFLIKIFNYTDDSKNIFRVGCAFFISDVFKEYQLHKFFSISSAELTAIKLLLESVATIVTARNLKIFPTSFQPLMHYNITLILIPWHRQFLLSFTPSTHLCGSLVSLPFDAKKLLTLQRSIQLSQNNLSFISCIFKLKIPLQTFLSSRRLTIWNNLMNHPNACEIPTSYSKNFFGLTQYVYCVYIVLCEYRFSYWSTDNVLCLLQIFDVCLLNKFC